MPLIRQTCAAALLIPMLAVPAHAQVSRLPMEVQEVLATLGPKWGTAPNIDATAAAFRPLLKAAPKDGVIVGKNLAYGEDAKQMLDVYQPIWRTSAPVVIFIHGGAYVRGDKDLRGDVRQHRYLVRPPGHARPQRDLPPGAGGEVAIGRR